MEFFQISISVCIGPISFNNHSIMWFIKKGYSLHFSKKTTTLRPIDAINSTINNTPALDASGLKSGQSNRKRNFVVSNKDALRRSNLILFVLVLEKQTFVTSLPDKPSRTRTIRQPAAGLTPETRHLSTIPSEAKRERGNLLVPETYTLRLCAFVAIFPV